MYKEVQPEAERITEEEDAACDEQAEQAAE